MSGGEGPKAPFTFRPDEPYLGEGALVRTRRRRFLTIVITLFVMLLVVGGLAFQRWLWSQSLDPSVNARTGLADGSYVLDVTRSYRTEGDCWFEGTVRGVPGAAHVQLYGVGATQCARSGDYVGHVLFSVASGQASITRVKGY